MADIFCIVNQKIKLSDPTRKTQLQQPLAYNNALAHSFRVTVSDDDGNDINLQGAGIGVAGNFLNASNQTIGPINGTTNENVAEVVLPQQCYQVPGRFKFTLNLTTSKDEPVGTYPTFSTGTAYAKDDKVVNPNDGYVYIFTSAHSAGAWNSSHVTRSIISYSRTALWVEGHVEKNTTNTIIVPGTPVDDLTSAIGRALSAAATAATAASSAQTAAAAASNYTDAIAPAYSDLVGDAITGGIQHCWYDGDLYVAKEDFTAGSTWDSTKWDLTDISEELSKCAHLDFDVADSNEVMPYMLNGGEN